MATENRSVEDAREARLRAVFEATTDGLIVVDGNHRIVAANPEACFMHGYPAGSLEGHLYTELIADEWVAIYRNLRAHPDLTGVVRLDKVHTRADGSRFDCEVRANWLRYDQGHDEVLINIRDLGERRRTVERLTQLSRTILIAQEEERTRLSRELHDQLGQLLSAIRLELGWVHTSTFENVEARRSVENCSHLVEQAADEVRRVCRGLRPPALDDLGIVPAIRNLAQDVEERADFTVDLNLELEDDPLRLPPEVELCVYRVLQEALTNTQRHGNAANVHVRLFRDGEDICLEARDDGQGFELDDSDTFRGLGLEGMQERARLVGGEAKVHSAPGQGTRIELRVPSSLRRGGSP